MRHGRWKSVQISPAPSDRAPTGTIAAPPNSASNGSCGRIFDENPARRMLVASADSSPRGARRGRDRRRRLFNDRPPEPYCSRRSYSALPILICFEPRTCLFFQCDPLLPIRGQHDLA
jgi:hypothetical protein